MTKPKTTAADINSLKNARLSLRKIAKLRHQKKTSLSSPPPDGMSAETGWFSLPSIFSDKPRRSTSFEDFEVGWPTVWTTALEAFRGKRVAARKWLETRSKIFKGKSPLTVVLQAGGKRKVLRVLKSLTRTQE